MICVVNVMLVLIILFIKKSLLCIRIKKMYETSDYKLLSLR